MLSALEPSIGQKERTSCPRSPVCPMIAPRITRLILTAFRSYRKLDLAVDAAMVVLTGQNGAGKTNVLEALSLFTQGKGLRRADLADMASHLPALQLVASEIDVGYERAVFALRGVEQLDCVLAG